MTEGMQLPNAFVPILLNKLYTTNISLLFKSHALYAVHIVCWGVLYDVLLSSALQVQGHIPGGI